MRYLFYVYQNSLSAVGQDKRLCLFRLAAEYGNCFLGAAELLAALCALHRTECSADLHERQAVFAQHVHRRDRARDRKIKALAQLAPTRLLGARMDYIGGKSELFNALRDERELFAGRVEHGELYLGAGYQQRNSRKAAARANVYDPVLRVELDHAKRSKAVRKVLYGYPLGVGYGGEIEHLVFFDEQRRKKLESFERLRIQVNADIGADIFKPVLIYHVSCSPSPDESAAPKYPQG